MFALTIRLPDKVIDDIDMRARKLRISRSEYIRRSIEYMNNEICEQERRSRLTLASKLVRQESMVINAEFSKVEYDPED